MEQARNKYGFPENLIRHDLRMRDVEQTIRGREWNFVTSLEEWFLFVWKNANIEGNWL